MTFSKKRFLAHIFAFFVALFPTAIFALYWNFGNVYFVLSIFDIVAVPIFGILLYKRDKKCLRSASFISIIAGIVVLACLYLLTGYEYEIQAFFAKEGVGSSIIILVLVSLLLFFGIKLNSFFEKKSKDNSLGTTAKTPDETQPQQTEQPLPPLTKVEEEILALAEKTPILTVKDILLNTKFGIDEVETALANLVNVHKLFAQWYKDYLLRNVVNINTLDEQLLSLWENGYKWSATISGFYYHWRNYPQKILSPIEIQQKEDEGLLYIGKLSFIKKLKLGSEEDWQKELVKYYEAKNRYNTQISFFKRAGHVSCVLFCVLILILYIIMKLGISLSDDFPIELLILGVGFILPFVFWGLSGIFTSKTWNMEQKISDRWFGKKPMGTTTKNIVIKEFNCERLKFFYPESWKSKFETLFGNNFMFYAYGESMCNIEIHWNHKNNFSEKEAIEEAIEREKKYLKGKKNITFSSFYNSTFKELQCLSVDYTAVEPFLFNKRKDCGNIISFIMNGITVVMSKHYNENNKEIINQMVKQIEEGFEII